MEYFELYNIPVSLKPNQQLVKQKFYELSRKYHPDFFANATDEEQADVLEKSSMVNKAFKTFQNPDATIKYVLQQKGLLEEEEKYQLPPDFLMEMLDLNEQLTEAKLEGDEERMKQVKILINEIESTIYEPVE